MDAVIALIGDCVINNLFTMHNLRAAAELTAHDTQRAVSLRTNMTALASVFTGSSHQDTMSHDGIPPFWGSKSFSGGELFYERGESAFYSSLHNVSVPR